MQEALGHAAALSRYFWPSLQGFWATKEIKMLRKKRAEMLKEEFNLTDHSPLADRSIRNAWEHFDEKLDAYLLSNSTGTFLPNPIIGDHRHISDNDPVFKMLDPIEGCLVILGKKYFYKPIRIEVENIYTQAAKSNMMSDS